MTESLRDPYLNHVFAAEEFRFMLEEKAVLFIRERVARFLTVAGRFVIIFRIDQF